MRQLLFAERVSCHNCLPSLLSYETHTFSGLSESQNLPHLLEPLRQLSLLVNENVLCTAPTCGMRGTSDIPGQCNLHGVLREDLQKVQRVLSQTTSEREVHRGTAAEHVCGLLQQVPLLGMLEGNLHFLSHLLLILRMIVFGGPLPQVGRGWELHRLVMVW